jgi:hypothetical protein
MTMTGSDARASRKPERKPREKGAAQALASIAQIAARGLESHRREEHRARKDLERVRILLTTYMGGALSMLSRMDIPDEDRAFLVAMGYIRERKERT